MLSTYFGLSRCKTFDLANGICYQGTHLGKPDVDVKIHTLLRVLCKAIDFNESLLITPSRASYGDYIDVDFETHYCCID